MSLKEFQHINFFPLKFPIFYCLQKFSPIADLNVQKGVKSSISNSRTYGILQLLQKLIFPISLNDFPLLSLIVPSVLQLFSCTIAFKFPIFNCFRNEKTFHTMQRLQKLLFQSSKKNFSHTIFVSKIPFTFPTFYCFRNFRLQLILTSKRSSKGLILILELLVACSYKKYFFKLPSTILACQYFSFIIPSKSPIFNCFLNESSLSDLWWGHQIPQHALTYFTFVRENKSLNSGEKHWSYNNIIKNFPMFFYATCLLTKIYCTNITLHTTYTHPFLR